MKFAKKMLAVPFQQGIESEKDKYIGKLESNTSNILNNPKLNIDAKLKLYNTAINRLREKYNPNTPSTAEQQLTSLNQINTNLDELNKNVKKEQEPVVEEEEEEEEEDDVSMKDDDDDVPPQNKPFFNSNLKDEDIQNDNLLVDPSLDSLYTINNYTNEIYKNTIEKAKEAKDSGPRLLNVMTPKQFVDTKNNEPWLALILYKQSEQKLTTNQKKELENIYSNYYNNYMHNNYKEIFKNNLKKSGLDASSLTEENISKIDKETLNQLSSVSKKYNQNILANYRYFLKNGKGFLTEDNDTYIREKLLKQIPKFKDLFIRRDNYQGAILGTQKNLKGKGLDFYFKWKTKKYF